MSLTVPYKTPSDVEAYREGIKEGRRLERKSLRRKIRRIPMGCVTEQNLLKALRGKEQP